VKIVGPRKDVTVTTFTLESSMALDIRRIHVVQNAHSLSRTEDRWSFPASFKVLPLTPGAVKQMPKKCQQKYVPRFTLINGLSN
jgi:hypothetical protein